MSEPQLTFQELKEIVDEGVFTDEELKNFYDVVTGEAWLKTCDNCGLTESKENMHLFYDNRNTDCIACTHARCRRNHIARREKRLKGKVLTKSK